MCGFVRVVLDFVCLCVCERMCVFLHACLHAYVCMLCA